ncbi:MAG: Hsp20/alpha crystallin family protein [Chloroflexota bacterium]
MKALLKGVFLYEFENCTRPCMDIFETDDTLAFEVDLPGVDPSAVSVRVYEELLIVEGCCVSDSEECSGSGVRFLCVERGMKRFRRIVKIPVQVNTQAGSAVYSRGVLTIAFPKLKGKLIKIRIDRPHAEAEAQR